MFEIRDIQLRLDPDPHRPEIRAYVSLLYGSLRLRSLLVVRGTSGKLHLAFPNTPIGARCVGCTRKVRIHHRYCYHCGARQPCRIPETTRPDGKPDVYASIVLPTTRAARAAFEAAVFHAFVEASNNRAKAS